MQSLLCYIIFVVNRTEILPYLYHMSLLHACLYFLLCSLGEWHQYDDIICAEPSKNVLKRLTQAIWPDQRKSLIEGREIAGAFMLETIFDLLSSWSEVNLKSFMTQLKQFYQIYGNPFIFEEKQEKWYSLRYEEEDVSSLIRYVIGSYMLVMSMFHI